MSLESKIEALTVAVQQLTAAMQAQGAVAQVVPSVPAAPVAPPAPPVAAPAAAPTLPPPPNFMAPPAAAPAGAPFSDIKGLVEYTVGKYNSLGAEKGSGINTVLTGLGYQNINDVKPEHFGAFYAGVEAIK